jgi:hypothetical protein
VPHIKNIRIRTRSVCMRICPVSVLNVEIFRQVNRQKLKIAVREGSLKRTAKLIAVTSKEVLSKHSIENYTCYTYALNKHTKYTNSQIIHMNTRK